MLYPVLPNCVPTSRSGPRPPVPVRLPDRYTAVKGIIDTLERKEGAKASENP